MSDAPTAPRAPDLHDGIAPATAGPPPGEGSAAAVLLHGRGGSAEDMLALFEALGVPNVSAIAPRARGHSWYPLPFTAPLEANQPWLDSALAVVADTLERLAGSGVARERTVLLGFSQGACLVSEFVARNARPYGGVVVLSGGLIGPEGGARVDEGTLAGTPVLLGCSDVDPHIPLARVRETSRVLGALGASVDERIYRGMGHTVNDDELEAARAVLRRAAGVDGAARG